jgi:uncharacterized damage-inducible protein DinB
MSRAETPADLTLRRAIAEHRNAINNAGTIKVRPGYEQVAEAKQRIDRRLWSLLDADLHEGQSGNSAPAIRVTLEHVVEGLEAHADALREGSVGTEEAQARWLDAQADHLRRVLEELKGRTL